VRSYLLLALHRGMAPPIADLSIMQWPHRNESPNTRVRARKARGYLRTTAAAPGIRAIAEKCLGVRYSAVHAPEPIHVLPEQGWTPRIADCAAPVVDGVPVSFRRVCGIDPMVNLTVVSRDRKTQKMVQADKMISGFKQKMVRASNHALVISDRKLQKRASALSDDPGASQPLGNERSEHSEITNPLGPLRVNGY
jgi:hypothetical protein